MRNILFAVCALATLLVEAKEVDSSVVKINSEAIFAVFEVEAKCTVPAYEDDPVRVYFSEQSYQEVKKYLQSDYSYRLLGATCKGEEGLKQLPTDKYETTKVVFYNYSDVKTNVDKAIDEQLQNYSKKFAQ